MLQSVRCREACAGRRTLGLALALLLLLGTARSASAQDAESSAPRKSRLVWLMEAEGIFFWPQLAISIAVVAIIATNFMACLRKRFVAAGFAEQFEGLVKNRQLKEAFELAKKSNTFLTRVLTAGLMRVAESYDEAIRSMQDIGEEENMKFEHRLSYLAMIANVATMVGLLGTVWGMVASFIVIGQSDIAPKPSALAQGVSQALVTTIIGLIQAIPAIIFFTIIKNLVATRVMEIGILSERMMQPFKALAKSGKG